MANVQESTFAARALGGMATPIVAPMSVVLVGGLARPMVSYIKFLRLIWPLWLALRIVCAAIICAVAGLAA